MTKVKKYLLPAALFVLGFAVAFAIMRSPPETPAAGGADALQTAELREFLRAVSGGDFPAMKELGERLFVKGRKIEDAGKAFAGYETNSVPPYTVYALHAENAPDAARRVLLTLDGDGRVESFLAEEMTVVQ
ncbi:MAG: hypothetical protein LBS30_07830 [Planctomycetota bacterium]|nr:hypothetical protein [Planctomycetota bacterium]